MPMTSWCRLRVSVTLVGVLVSAPLGSLCHVPRNVAHLLALGQELVEILHALAVLDKELRLSGYRLLALDEV